MQLHLMTVLKRAVIGTGALAGLGAMSTAQATIPAPVDHELHPVWGGQSQAIHTADIGGSNRIIVGTGGGGIRVSGSGGAQGTWSYADTPNDFTHTLIDIEFIDDDTGFACGRGGRVLKTVDGGATWTDFGTPIADPCGDGATLWSLHPFSSQAMIIVGLWTTKYTVNGGQTWGDIQLFDRNTSGTGTAYDGPPMLPDDFHFYAVAAAGSLGQFKGSIAAEWKHPSGLSRGVVFHTNTLEAGSGSGLKWRMTLNDLDQSITDGVTANMPEPWGLTFERGATLASAIGYVVGGRGTNNAGRVYRTDNGGKSWKREQDFTTTSYTVTAEAGIAMAGAYSGGVWTRDTLGAWSLQVLPGPTNGLLTPGLTTVAVHVIDSSSPSHFVVGGGFGLNIQSLDGGANWIEASPYYQLDVEELRIRDLATVPGSPSTAFVVGQNSHVMKTVNDGQDWVMQQIETPPNPRTLRGVDFRDASNGVAVGDKGALWYTANGGVSTAPGNTGWTASATPLGGMGSVWFTDVTSFGNNEAWAVGQDSATGNGTIAYTRDKGRNWFRLSAPVQANLALEGVVFPEKTKGIVVGWSRDANGTVRARAYTADFTPTTGAIAWVEVSPTHPFLVPISGNPVSRKLHGIDSAGTSLASAVIYTVGNDGMVLKWNGALSRFDNVPGVYVQNVQGAISFQELETDLITVGISPSGSRVLIGSQYDADISTAADFGWMLELNGTWSRTRAMSGKDMIAIGLTSDTEGFVAGQTTTNASFGNGTRLLHCDGYSDEDVGSNSFDHPNLADPVILKYLSN